MTSTSCSGAAHDLLERCLRGDAPAELPAALLRDGCASALFGIWIEGLADRFEPALCDVYARLFSRALPGEGLFERYCRVRQVRPVDWEPGSVTVLSRVTLGADVAVTSVLMDAAKRRFPKARIRFAGPAKNYEMFAADPLVEHVPVEYRRGALSERLEAWRAIPADDLVLDPDSRLTQLGLLPVGAESRYRLFESRAYGGDSASALPQLAARWAEETLGAGGARPYLALRIPSPVPSGGIAVNLGVGDNEAKRLPDPFEEELLRLLGATGLPLVVDSGAGGEERERVERAVARSGAPATIFRGPFAQFAAAIAASRMYVGYDSAGQHVAAAAGAPLVSIFAGFPVPRMFDRWRPAAPNATVLRIDRPDPDSALALVRRAVAHTLSLRESR